MSPQLPSTPPSPPALLHLPLPSLGPALPAPPPTHLPLRPAPSAPPSLASLCQGRPWRSRGAGDVVTLRTAAWWSRGLPLSQFPPVASPGSCSSRPGPGGPWLRGSPGRSSEARSGLLLEGNRDCAVFTLSWCLGQVGGRVECWGESPGVTALPCLPPGLGVGSPSYSCEPGPAGPWAPRALKTVALCRDGLGPPRSPQLGLRPVAASETRGCSSQGPGPGPALRSLFFSWHRTPARVGAKCQEEGGGPSGWAARRSRAGRNQTQGWGRALMSPQDTLAGLGERGGGPVRTVRGHSTEPVSSLSVPGRWGCGQRLLSEAWVRRGRRAHPVGGLSFRSLWMLCPAWETLRTWLEEPTVAFPQTLDLAPR